MSVCTVSGCSGVPVLQWQRQATQAEADAHWAGMQEAQDRLTAYRRGSLELQIGDLESMRDRLQAEGKLTPGAAKVLGEQIAGKQAALERDVPAVVFAGGDVKIPVFGCAEHAVDLETAGWLHQAGCLAESSCGCVEPAPGVDVPDGPDGA